MKNKFKILFISLLLISLSSQAQKVRYANYWLWPKISKNKVEEIAKYDLVILDNENIFNNKEAMYKLKEINPNIIILCYFNSMEIFDSEHLSLYKDRPFASTIYKYLSTTNKWWLKNYKREIIRFDERQLMLNLSSKSESFYVSYFDKKMQYWEFITQMHLDWVLKDSIWDGVFEDNFETVEWLALKNEKQGVDIDCDDKADKQKQISKFWQTGLSERLKMILKNKPNYIIMGNKGKNFLPEYTHGKMFENFPDIYLTHDFENYNQNMQNALEIDTAVIFNVVDTNHYYLAFASAMLLDKPVYLSVGQQDIWRDYYLDPKDFGKAVSEATTKFNRKTYNRQFEKGYITIISGDDKYSSILYKIILYKNDKIIKIEGSILKQKPDPIE